MKIIYKIKLKYLYYCKFKSLTNWEKEFVTNLYKSKELTLRQIVKINEIFDKIRHGNDVKFYDKNHQIENYKPFKDNNFDPEDFDYSYDEVHDFDRD